MKPQKLFSTITAAFKAPFKARAKKRLQASTRAASRSGMDDYDEEEPTTNLSSSFAVVLVLHVVAVGGIYAFNSIKASRKDHDVAAAPAIEKATPAPPKPVAQKQIAANPPAAAHPTAPAAHPTEAAPVPAIAPVHPANARQHQVKTGDNLTKLAIAYGVTPAEIMEANHLKEGALLQKGTVLTIPPAKASAKAADTHKIDTTPKQSDVPPTSTTPGLHTVRKGDTMTSIAHNYGVTVEELLKANKAVDPKKLQLGQTLKVPPRKS